MNDSQREILLIAQEECAEVTQAISKIFRFGLQSEHNGRTNKEHLEEEMGDLLCMLQLIEEYDMADWTRVSVCASRKRAKLKQWSSIEV